MTDIVKGSPRLAAPGPRTLHVAEVLDFRPDQGTSAFTSNGFVILSAAAMGLLRKELVDTLGLQTATFRFETLRTEPVVDQSCHCAVNL